MLNNFMKTAYFLLQATCRLFHDPAKAVIQQLEKQSYQDQQRYSNLKIVDDNKRWWHNPFMGPKPFEFGQVFREDTQEDIEKQILNEFFQTVMDENKINFEQALSNTIKSLWGEGDKDWLMQLSQKFPHLHVETLVKQSWFQNAITQIAAGNNQLNTATASY